ncbi:unnamed protein product [Peniophora sp. CBMAI 1063]|nr:unnamed protein product [Peniophora sp. CBMAI 1063]
MLLCAPAVFILSLALQGHGKPLSPPPRIIFARSVTTATSLLESPSISGDIFALHGHNLIANHLDEQGMPPGDLPAAQSLVLDAFASNTSAANLTDPVGILGAGASGLYTALILLDLGIPFKIIEARERVGGRLFTYTFPNSTGAPYNYFDVGAMRFPNTSSMTRAFQLFDYAPLNENGLNLSSKLRPYIFKSEHSLLSYNDVTVAQDDVQALAQDPFHTNAVIRDKNSSAYLSVGADTIVNDVLKPFAIGLLSDAQNHTTTGWDHMKKYDKYSARSYMATEYRPSKSLGLPDKPLPLDVIAWCETFEDSSGAYDRALSEIVLDSIDFGWSENPRKSAKWYLIDGGAYEIADTMAQYIKSQQPDAFSLNTFVTAVSSDKNGTKAIGVNVTTDYNSTQRFSHVVSTIPLPVMRTLDLTDAGLSPIQLNALRELEYGPAVKIGMQFASAWWTNGTTNSGRKLDIVGGQTYTDSLLRTVVYPSYGDPYSGNTTTLIASYSWTADADRLASLVAGDQSRLKAVVLRELARIHDVDEAFLREQLIDTFAWSWSLDPYTGGAFAFFGPGQFEDLYTSLTKPAAGGHLHFAGEALSTRHAWIEGSFDSAWRAVLSILVQQKGLKHLIPKFFDNWGSNEEWVRTVKKGDGTEEKMDVEAMLRDSLFVKHLVAV